METFIKFFMGLGKPKYDINNVALFGFGHLSGIILAELPRARSGAPWVRQFGNPSIPENLVMT